MRMVLIVIVLLSMLIMPVNAIDIEAPNAPDAVQEYINNNTDSFSDGFLYIILQVLPKIQPNITEAGKTCISIICVCILLSLFEAISIKNGLFHTSFSVVSISVLLLRSVNSLIRLGSRTVTELSEYGKLFIPVMTAALATQGGPATSAALYAGTVFSNTLLCSLISKLLIPALYIYLCMSIIHKVTMNPLLERINHSIKWLMTWGLKLILYIFTAYMSITGVISGSTDTSMLKATKILVSGAVPVVGNIISDVSDSMLISAGIMKNSAGVYGMLVMIAIIIGPFIKIGIHYLMLKGTSGICQLFSCNQTTGIIDNFSTVMGFILAMVGTVCIMLLFSTICFLKGVT